MSAATALVIAVLAAIGGGAIASLISGLFSRPKSRAEVGKLVAEEGRTIDERWKSWAEELEERIVSMETELKMTRGVNDELRTQLTEVQTQLTKTQNLLRREQAVTRNLIGWAFAMRDEIRRLGGSIPGAPTDVEDFIAGLEVPNFPSTMRFQNDDDPA